MVYRVLALVAATILLALIAGAGRSTSPAAATHSSATAVGIDDDPTGNQPNSLGPVISDCRSVAPAEAFSVDLYVRDVDLIGFYLLLSFDPARLRVIGNDVNMMLASGSGNHVQDFSEPPSFLDDDGLYASSALGFANPFTAVDGGGVMARVTLQALGSGTSVLSINFANQSPILTAADGSAVQPADIFAVFQGTVTEAEERIGTACPQDADADGTAAFLGDVDCDGPADAVDVVDALFILQNVAGLRAASDACPPPSGSLYEGAADADCDLDVDAVDGLFVLQHVAGLRPELCPP